MFLYWLNFCLLSKIKGVFFYKTHPPIRTFLWILIKSKLPLLFIRELVSMLRNHWRYCHFNRQKYCLNRNSWIDFWSREKQPLWIRLRTKVTPWLILHFVIIYLRTYVTRNDLSWFDASPRTALCFISKWRYVVLILHKNHAHVKFVILLSNTNTYHAITTNSP